LKEAIVAGRGRRISQPAPSRLTRLADNEKFLAAALLAPGVIILALFIAYPFVMALWFSLTSIRVGDEGQFVGLANFAKAIDDTIFRQAFRNTVFYTFWATIFKLALGMWLAVLLNRHFRFKASCAPRCCCPSSSRRCSRRSPWRWMFDPTFSVMNWSSTTGASSPTACRSSRAASGRCGAR
jgi:multiple sugar transport system permease protein